MIFVSILFYTSYQKGYPRFSPRESYVIKSNKEFPGNTRNYSTNNVPDSHQDNPSQGERSDLIPASLKRPQPLFVPITSKNEECLPIYKSLRVKTVPEHNCDQPHVTMNTGGRLGNKMCQYASLYLLRHLFGVRISIRKPMKDWLGRYMKNIVLPLQDSICFTNRTESIKYDTMYMKLYKAALRANTNAVDNTVIEPLINVSYYVYNNPGPRGLLMAHRDLVRSLFTFRDEVVKQAVHNIDEALKAFNVAYYNRNFSVVTVHVRRFKLTQLDDFYFRGAFAFYKTRLTRPVFLVVSDDPAWCKQRLQANDVVVIGSASAAVDMAVMSLGDHHVTSYGTYSFISVLLGRGHITHPIGHNTKYNLVDCVDSPFFHHISRDSTYEVDNSNVVLS